MSSSSNSVDLFPARVSNDSVNNYINPLFIADVNLLITSVNDKDITTQYDYDWYLFDVFTKKWGTHIVTGVEYGSSYQKIYCLASETEDTWETLEASLQIQGKFPGIDVKVKSTITIETRTKIQNVEIIETDYILGGDAISVAGILMPISGDDDGTNWHNRVSNFVNSSKINNGILDNIILRIDDLITNISTCKNPNGNYMYNAVKYTDFAGKLKYYYENVLTNSTINVFKNLRTGSDNKFTIKNKFTDQYITSSSETDLKLSPQVDSTDTTDKQNFYLYPYTGDDPHKEGQNTVLYSSATATSGIASLLSTLQDGTYGTDLGFYKYNTPPGRSLYNDRWVYRNDGTIRSYYDNDMCLSFATNKDVNGISLTNDGKIIMDIYKPGDPKQKWTFKYLDTPTPQLVSCRNINM